MTKRISNPQQWIAGFDLANMTPAELLALINVLVDDTLPGMNAGYYQRRLEVIGVLARIAQQKSSAG